MKCDAFSANRQGVTGVSKNMRAKWKSVGGVLLLAAVSAQAAETTERTDPVGTLCRERTAPPEACVINDGPPRPPVARGGAALLPSAITPSIPTPAAALDGSARGTPGAIAQPHSSDPTTPATTTPTTVTPTTPGAVPTLSPGNVPTLLPGNVPTLLPGSVPTLLPGNVPTLSPGNVPTLIPGTPGASPSVPASAGTSSSNGAGAADGATRRGAPSGRTSAHGAGK
jgi:hypothetical protein